MMEYVRSSRMKCALKVSLAIAAVAMLSGCAHISTAIDGRENPAERRVFDLKQISPQQAQAFLAKLAIDETSIVPQQNAVAVCGSTADLYRAGILMDLVDTQEEYCVEPLASVANAATIPENSRTAAALGDIAIGTFAAPPAQGERTRGIIDIHDAYVVAIVPVRVQKNLLDFIRSSTTTRRPVAIAPQDVNAPAAVERRESVATVQDGDEPVPPSPDEDAQQATLQAKSSSQVGAVLETIAQVAPTGQTDSCEKSNACVSKDEPVTEESNTPTPATTKHLYDLAPLPNGDDVLQLDLPDQVEVSQLLDLAAEYLHIDYMFDPEKIRGQTVSLRLHGKLQGNIRIKDLYPLLESVLKFKGFAMTRHKDNLVTIVPMAEALQADPTLVDPNGTSLEAGAMVVTRVFNLRYVTPASAMALLDNMKISVACSIVQETRSLIVTSYVHRMERVERLIEMVDRPGRPRQFRYRELKYTTADTLCKKVEMLVAQLQSTPMEIAPSEQRLASLGLQVRTPLVASPPTQRLVDNGSLSESAEPCTVYLDADKRTNRILMVGLPEQLATVDEVIDAIDVVQQDQRTFKVYEIKHVDAEEVKKHLARFDLIDEKEPAIPHQTAPVNADPAAPVQTASLISFTGTNDLNERQKPQVSVLHASNSLLVKATPLQHVQIAHVIDYVDTVAREESIPYEIYFLENQDPEHMAEVLHKLLQESMEDKNAKIENVVRRPEDEIVIVPDKNTFSLIVYASRKNQDWIRKLVKTLDKRRPQVLIDATLVEIRKNDEFNYDLEMVASLPDLTPTSGQTGQFMADENTTVADRLQSSGRSRFVDFQVKSGKGIGFYADDSIQALLTAVQTKDYGRVLAKPKVLVNDNEKGNIKTADTTYVITKSSVPVTGGTAGQQNQLIETAVGYEPYEAGINLEITPHISDDDLLRLEVQLTRSDFTSTSDEKPPNQTSSNVGTVVTIPDGSTIILGGMLKLNQNKGGSKVPILGDLPLVGGLFRGVNTSDVQSMLYIFVRAEIIRPADTVVNTYQDLKRISDENRRAFEEHEREFQDYQTWPGVKPKPVSPPKVLDAR